MKVKFSGWILIATSFSVMSVYGYVEPLRNTSPLTAEVTSLLPLLQNTFQEIMREIICLVKNPFPGKNLRLDGPKIRETEQCGGET